MAVLVDLEGVGLKRADRTLFDKLSLTVKDGERLGVVGINGTGKSTLLRIIAGIERPDTGDVRRGRGVRVGFLAQEAELPASSVRDAVGPGWEAEAALDRLGMGSALDLQTTELSGGQAKRVALAATLCQPCELLILDEPTNHLDIRAIDWLEQWILGFRGALIIVTHDRHLLDRVTTRMLELDRGRDYVHEGGYSSYLEAAGERSAQADVAESIRRNLARRELAWLRRGAPARTRKPRARQEAAKALIASRPEAAARSADIDLSFGAPRLGDQVIECTGVSFAYEGQSAPVFTGVELMLDPQERLAIVGANGSGKSTLLDVLAGRRSPATGTVTTGSTVVTGYHDQGGMELDVDARVRDLVAGPTRAPGAPEDVLLMERFWFAGAVQFAQAGSLSGGERRRLQLLLVLASRPNVLFLDEPTNDLDIDTLRILEDFLDDWPGAVVVVSHDRTFLERTTDRLLAVEDGAVTGVPGGLAAWVARSTASAPPRPAKASTSAGRAPQLVAPATGPKTRSASTLGRLLRDAEKEMARLTRQREELHEAMSVAGHDHVELARLGRELLDLQDRLDAAEHNWLEVAEESESSGLSRRGGDK